MIATCPKCGSRRFRISKRRDLGARLGEYIGIFRLKCLDCSTRYRRVWSLKDWLYAKCPRCLRTDLTFWSPEYYRAPFSITLKLALGARRIRCEACRHNFASWRVVKQKYQRPQTINESSMPTADHL